MTVFGNLWSTPETDELFGDEGRLNDKLVGASSPAA